MSMPDEIWAKIQDVYDLCCPSGTLNVWSEDNNYDGSLEYHSDDKYKALQARIKELEDMLLGDTENLQARIDGLMLEYCPDEMTDLQLKRWESRQKPSLKDKK